MEETTSTPIVIELEKLRDEETKENVVSEETKELKVKTDFAVLVWKNLTVSVGKKELLKNLNGQITGGFWAVMGPSGSGKSTLLNTLACRLDVATKQEGEVRLNGRPYKNTQLKNSSGYVMQDDLLNGRLTVQETLEYAAHLRLPATATEEDRINRVNKVILQMGLDHCRQTIIGDPLRKGISGGERRRVCVALELLTEPILLFLDEPTSGLDSVTAYELCKTLRGLSESGSCTVVCTIHQPQSKIFFLFTHLILLKSGKILYQGLAKESIDYFTKSGFPLPAYTNPADHFMDVITPPMGRIEGTPTKRGYEKLFPEEPEVNLELGIDKPFFRPREVQPWHKQFSILFERSLKETIRNYPIIIASFVQAIVIAILIGTVFLQIGTSQTSTVRRQPVLFFCVINQGIFGALMVINSFPAERALSLRERAAGTYCASAYFTAKIGAETLVNLPFPVIFSCIVYWLVGLQASASKFFIFAIFMVLCSLSATSLALMISTFCRTVSMSVTVLPICLEIARLFGGFFLAPAILPGYFSWLDALSYVKYTYVAISLNELTGLELYCLPSQLKNGACPITSGEQTIKSLGFDAYTIGQCAGILLFYIIGTRFLAYIGLRFIKW